MKRGALLFVSLLELLVVPATHAQTNLQLWGNVTADWAPGRRIVLRDLVRVESRHFFYTGEGRGPSSVVRLRNRLEFLVPLNRETLSEDGAR